MEFKPSLTEEHGLALLDPTMKKILSIGISTGGSAEIRMAQLCPGATVIATTVDEKGLAFSRETIAKTKYNHRIATKIEDCAQPWKYAENTFDYIYARLVFHYLTRQQLSIALKEMHRTLKKESRAFIVVRSIDEPELGDSISGTQHCEETGFTTYTDFAGKVVSRQFFSENSLRNILETTGFKIERIETVYEKCFQDYQRTIQNPNPNTLIEVVVSK